MARILQYTEGQGLLEGPDSVVCEPIVMFMMTQ
jgi:hypothetical protein